jgi:uncharacterized membrane protein YdbT with pleckstrin-like domain
MRLELTRLLVGHSSHSRHRLFKVSHLPPSVVILFPAISLIALSPAPWHPDIVLIGAAVAFNAVLEVSNSFFDVLAPDLLR